MAKNRNNFPPERDGYTLKDFQDLKPRPSTFQMFRVQSITVGKKIFASAGRKGFAMTAKEGAGRGGPEAGGRNN